MRHGSCRCHEVDSARFFWGKATHDLRLESDRKRSRAIRRRRPGGVSVFLAAFLVGGSAGALIWGLEQVVQGNARAHARSQLRSTLRDARHLLTGRGTDASRTASRFARSQTVQNAFLDRAPGPLRAIARSNQDVGFVLWDGTTVGHRAVA